MGGDTEAAELREDSEEEASGENRPQSALEAFATDLNGLARAGAIDPLVGREDEVERVIQILCRRRKNNPLLVGESGVGKTAIAEGLAKRIVDGEVPEVVGESNVFALDLGSLLAGTKYRGDFEKRFKMLLKELKKSPHTILFIDEIHTIIGAGAASGGGHGRVQPAQAAPRFGGDPLHGIDHLPGVSGHLRQGPGAVAPVPEDRHHRALASTTPTRSSAG